MKRLTFERADEYETSTAFARRTAGAADTSAVAFALPTSSIFYDADRGAFYVSLFTEPVNVEDRASAKFFGVEVWRRTQSLGEYPARNAFGVEKTVSKKQVDIITVAPEESPIGFGLGVKLAAAPDSARSLSPHLRALLVFKPRQLDGWFVNDSRGVRKPTLARPEEVVQRTRSLLASEIVAWIYHEQTRRILVKKNLLKVSEADYRE